MTGFLRAAPLLLATLALDLCHWEDGSANAFWGRAPTPESPYYYYGGSYYAPPAYSAPQPAPLRPVTTTTCTRTGQTINCMTVN